MEENKNEEPVVDNTVEKQKIKKKPSMKKMNADTDGITKVDLKELAAKPEDVAKIDLSKPLEEEVKENSVDNNTIVASAENNETLQEEVKSETPVLEEVTEEVEEIAAVAEEAIKESVETGKPLPENIEKLMSFMEDTGGDLNDYVKL